MEKKTRFSIGDTVYPIGHFYTKDWAKSKYKVIGSMKVRTVYNHDNFIRYGNGCHLEYNEQDCFATETEAQKECDKRNKG